MKIRALMLASLLASGFAYGQDAMDGGQKTNWYGQLGYMKLKTDMGITQVGQTYRGTVKPSMIRGVVGYDFEPNIGGEVMVGFGSQSASAMVLQKKYEVEVKTLVGIYIVPKITLADKFQIYGRAGLSNVTVDPNLSSTPGRSNSFSWGVGASYRFKDNLSAYGDYMIYHKTKDTKVQGVNIGIGYKF